MKSKLAIIALSVGLLTPSLALAQENNMQGHLKANIGTEMRLRASTTLDERRSTTTLKEKIESQKEKLKQNVKEKRSEAEDKIRAKFQEFFGKVVERFDAATDRLDKIVLRIESRLIKLESEGADESKARTLLADAKIKLNTAKLSITDISITASSTVNASTTIKMNYPEVRTAIEKAKSDLKAAQEALIEVVRNIKPGQNKIHATSTTEVNNQ